MALLFNEAPPEIDRLEYLPAGPRPAAHPDRVDLFLQQAARYPDHPAVKLSTGATSYTQLETRVRMFAARIARQPDPRVLIALPQGVDAYAAMLATGLAGGYYSPLNLAAPIDRLRLIARSLQPDIIVGHPDLTAVLAEEAAGAILLDPESLSPEVSFAGRGHRHDIAYVIFTSGTTGVPKGVVIGRRALDHYVAWLRADLSPGPEDRISQYPNVAFDLSVMDIYGALCSGATLCPLLGQGARLLPGRAIARERITIWVSVPSVIDLMMQERPVLREQLRSVRRFVFCGEPLLREHVVALFEACPDAVVQNTYGPTEATVSMTSIHLTAANFRQHRTASVTLGEPIRGMDLCLAGGWHADEGELVIAGPQVALGYWQDPGRTAQSFRMVSIGDRTMRGYATGDWVERRGGLLYFKGRIDLQLKVRGYRIEPDDVAAAIRRCGWPTACVFKHEESLAAIIENSFDHPFDETHLRAELATLLEPHMIPRLIRTIGRLPRSDNEKIDRRAAAEWLASCLAGA